MKNPPKMTIKISTPATSANLGAGFDALGLALDLRNEFCLRTGGLDRVHIEGCSAHAAALKKNNLFVSILREQLAALGADGSQRLDIAMNNRIALSRGMGSSSSVIIAAIAAANAIAGAGLSDAQILARSLRYEPHTDNTAPCLHGGFCISQPPVAGATGVAEIGDKTAARGWGARGDGRTGGAEIGDISGVVRVAKFAPPAGLRAVVAVPKVRMSTAASRAALAQNVPLQQASANVAKAAQIAAALASGRCELLLDAWGDFLHQRGRMRVHKEVYAQIFSALAAAGFLQRADILQHFGEEFLPPLSASPVGPASAAAAPEISPISATPVVLSPRAPHSAADAVFFAALSGSGSSFLLLVRAEFAAQIAAVLRPIAALEAVHDLALDAKGLVCEIC